MTDVRDKKFFNILARLAAVTSLEEENEIGRTELASVVFHASPEMLERILKEARRNHRLRRALAAARYYSGLSAAKCESIDELLKAPFSRARR